MLDEQYIHEKAREAKEYAESRQFPTSSPYSSNPYRARTLMLALVEIIKKLMAERKEK